MMLIDSVRNPDWTVPRGYVTNSRRMAGRATARATA